MFKRAKRPVFRGLSGFVETPVNKASTYSNEDGTLILLGIKEREAEAYISGLSQIDDLRVKHAEAGNTRYWRFQQGVSTAYVLRQGDDYALLNFHPSDMASSKPLPLDQLLAALAFE